MIFTTMEKNINSNDILIKTMNKLRTTLMQIFWCSSNLYSQSSNYIFKFHYQVKRIYIQN